MYSPIEILIFIAIVAPTLVAFVYGAPFVPTPMPAVKKMLQVSGMKEGDRVYDIGCGDGRMVHLASKLYGARATGLELSPLVYALAKIRQLFWRSKAQILLRDFRGVNISDADYVLCYLMPDTLAVFRAKFAQELKPGAKIVSYAFHIRDWEPVHEEPSNKEEKRARILVYEMGKSNVAA